MSQAMEIHPGDDLPATTGNDQFVSMIERIAMDPSIPLDRLERMLDMKERMEDRARADADREAKKAYFAAMSKCQAELPVVTKNQKNDHTKSNYADLAAIEQQAMPVIHRFGFAVSFQPDGYNEAGELRIKWEISHEGGHSRDGVGEIPVDGAGSQGKVNKTGTQAFGSTATYGRRYLLCMLFNITTGDDNDGNSAAPVDAITDEQALNINDLIDTVVEEVSGDRPAFVKSFLKFMKADRIEAIAAKDHQKAVNAINASRTAR